MLKVSGRASRVRIRSLLLGLVAAATLVGCSALGGASDDEPSASGNGPEKTTVRVSVVPAVDLVPFHLAMARGFFSDAGLKVKPVPVGNGMAVQKLSAGEVDIAYSSYLPFFLAQGKGILEGNDGVKILSGASAASSNSSVLMAMPSAKVDSVEDLAGKRVAIPAPGTIAELMVKATMKDHDVSYDDVKWVATALPTSPQALEAGRIDAAFMVDPFIQLGKSKVGAKSIVDLCEGSVADMPLSGWGSTGRFAAANPKTVAAFQRAMQRGTKVAATDRGAVEETLVKALHVDEKAAKLTTTPKFESTPSAGELQRVPDLMREFGMLKKDVNVPDMIAK